MVRGGEIMENFDMWHENARNEFKNGEFYETGMGEEFQVTQDGSVHLNNLQVIKNAVTPFTE